MDMHEDILWKFKELAYKMGYDPDDVRPMGENDIILPHGMKSKVLEIIDKMIDEVEALEDEH